MNQRGAGNDEEEKTRSGRLDVSRALLRSSATDSSGEESPYTSRLDVVGSLWKNVKLIARFSRMEGGEEQEKALVGKGEMRSAQEPTRFGVTRPSSRLAYSASSPGRRGRDEEKKEKERVRCPHTALSKSLRGRERIGERRWAIQSGGFSFLHAESGGRPGREGWGELKKF